MAVTVWPGAGASAGLVVDDFSDVDNPNPWPVSTTIPAVIPVLESGLSGVVGGTRNTTLSALVLDLVGLDEVKTNIVPNFGVLDYTSSVGGNGELELSYVGPFDVDLSGDAFIQIDFVGLVLGSKLAMPVTVTVAHGATTASLTHTLIAPGAQSVEFEFVDFAGIDLVDLGSITTMLVEFDPGAGADFRLSQIQSVVPEPATLVLLLVGAGVVLRRPRRR